MTRLLRRATFAVPFGCLVAIATHAVRFGDEHAFGGVASETLVAAAVGGSTAIALTILHRQNRFDPSTPFKDRFASHLPPSREIAIGALDGEF
jgi:hypothetical protein